jgi:hypothetical protein
MTAVLSEASAAQRRVEAFCSPAGAEVFRSVVGHQEIWRPDPFDVETIHEEARDAFQRLLTRAANRPPGGSILLLLGVSGSGKTHLMRAFRTYVHGDGRGYCGYLQMTSAASNYARYILTNLIDALDQPYQPPEIETSGLMRLSLGLLECVPNLTEEERTQFRDGYLSNDDLARRVHQYADCVVTDGRFQGIDIDLLRALLFLQRDDPRVRARVLKFLRCEELAKFDRELIGDLAGRPGDEEPLRMIAGLGKLMYAVHELPIVLCVDQLEDTFAEENAERTFRRAASSIVALTSAVPTAAVVVACLEDYYTAQRGLLSMPQRDRIESDPEPVRLTTQRTPDEIEAIVARRLQCLYEERDVPFDPQAPLQPFTRAHLRPLANMRTRDVLDYCRRHRDRCVAAGRWLEPAGNEDRRTPDGAPLPSLELEQTWNDFHTGFRALIPDDEESKAEVLAAAIQHCSDEASDGSRFAAGPDGRLIHVESRGPDNAAERLLVGVCDKGTQGGGLARQISALEATAGEARAVVARSSPFPASPRAAANLQLGKLVSGKRWRRVVVEDAHWRRMLAMQAFRATHGRRADFKAWLRQTRPLTQLPPLQQILALDRPAAAPAAAPLPAPVPPPAAPALALAGPLVLGAKRGVGGDPVTLEPNRLAHHMAFLGGTGSGKTTAALNLLEQLLLRGVPAVLVDRKGDLCRYADTDALAAPLPEAEPETRRRLLRERVEVALYTPGQPGGRPLTIPLVPDGKESLNSADRELLAAYAAAALGGMMNYRSSGTDKQKLAVLRKALELLGDLAGKEASLPNLIRYLEDGDDTLFAAVGNLADARLFDKLARDLQTLHINQSRLLAGDAERLNLDALLGLNEHAKPGKTRLSIISTRFLEASAAEFWVSQFLTALNRWCARRPRGELQAVLLFDEADLYLPATRQPATKAPMESLLKRGRSAGVGVFLATQSPGDFDYKCRDNIQTWLVGRVKEETALKKLRPMFSECRVDVAAKLPGQEPGQFYLLREREATALQAAPSVMKTEQVAEERILELARANAGGGVTV